MNKHNKINSLLPFYLNHQLDQKQTTQVKKHLASCKECQEDLKFWQSIDTSLAIKTESFTPSVSTSVLDSISAQINHSSSLKNKLDRFIEILKTQFILIRKEIWTASFLILLIGFIITIIMDSEPFFYAIAPLVSAASVSVIYNRESDPAIELVLSTPISQIQLILIRLFLVFAYNTLLVLIFSAGLMLNSTNQIILPLIHNWLAPMTFLSSLGITISILSNSENAIIISYSIWLSKYFINIPEIKKTFSNITNWIHYFWSSPNLIFALSAILLAIMLIFIKKNLGQTITKPTHISTI